jgi:hypothetical protein
VSYFTPRQKLIVFSGWTLFVYWVTAYYLTPACLPY